MPPGTQKSGGAGLAIGIGVGFVALVIVGVLGYGGVQKYLEQAKQHAPISTADDAGLVHRGPLERPFPFGTHPAPAETQLCSEQRCVIYAATEHALYELDPHQPASETFRCNFGGAIAPNNSVSDIAVSEQGALYAITAGELYRIPNPFDCKAELIGRLTPAFAFNGLTFTRAGELLAADPQGNVARIDPATAAVTLAGTFGSGLGCSGDLVGLADGTVFATARELSSPNLQGDWLVRLDPNTARGHQGRDDWPRRHLGARRLGHAAHRPRPRGPHHRARSAHREGPGGDDRAQPRVDWRRRDDVGARGVEVADWRDAVAPREPTRELRRHRSFWRAQCDAG